MWEYNKWSIPSSAVDRSGYIQRDLLGSGLEGGKRSEQKGGEERRRGESAEEGGETDGDIEEWERDSRDEIFLQFG